MYSYEIDEFLKSNDYKIHVSEYERICDIKKNPQIKRLKYDPFNDVFEMYTNDGYHWIFRVWK